MLNKVKKGTGLLTEIFQNHSMVSWNLTEFMHYHWWYQWLYYIKTYFLCMIQLYAAVFVIRLLQTDCWSSQNIKDGLKVIRIWCHHRVRSHEGEFLSMKHRELQHQALKLHYFGRKGIIYKDGLWCTNFWNFLMCRGLPTVWMNHGINTRTVIMQWKK
jgi:hypothetical protein